MCLQGSAWFSGHYSLSIRYSDYCLPRFIDILLVVIIKESSYTQVLSTKLDKISPTLTDSTDQLPHRIYSPFWKALVQRIQEIHTVFWETRRVCKHCSIQNLQKFSKSFKKLWKRTVGLGIGSWGLVSRHRKPTYQLFWCFSCFHPTECFPSSSL